MHPEGLGPNLGVLQQRVSPLMQAKAKSRGNKVNACPFGCDLEDLDDLGYCKHLVGFTTDKKTYEPMRRREDGRLQVYGEEKKPLQPGDKLVEITLSHRVYRQQADKQAVDKK